MACRGVANQSSPLVTPRQEAKTGASGFAMLCRTRSDTTTLGILGTLAHFRHSLRFNQAKPIISDHAQRTWF